MTDSVAQQHVDRPGRVALNCVVLIAAGVGFCFWTIYYTDWFPVIGGILGLTGAFAWVGVLSNLITEDRKKALQAWADRSFLQTWIPCILVGTLAATFLVGVAASHGTVVVNAKGDEVARAITIAPVPQPGEPAPSEPEAELASSPGTESTALLATDLFSAREYQLVAKGLPTIRFEVRPFHRRHIKLPDDPMTTPVVLLRPDSVLSGLSVQGKHALEIKVDGKDYGRLDDYRGTTVWLGATRDVSIPRETSDNWRAKEVVDPNMKDPVVRDAVLARWRSASAIPGDFQLQAGMRVRAAVITTEDKQVIGIACQTVTMPNDRRDFPEELVIDVKTDECQ